LFLVKEIIAQTTGEISRGSPRFKSWEIIENFGDREIQGVQTPLGQWPSESHQL
jgi:hypothetical protein